MPVCVTPHQIRNEIRTFLGLAIFCDFSPICCLSVGSPGHVLVCPVCADSWLREGCFVYSPRASECYWPGGTTRAVGAGVLLQLILALCFLHQNRSTTCSFHFIRHPPTTSQQHKWLTKALTHYSACGRDLYGCCLPFPTQAAVPGQRLTGEPKRQQISTVALCAMI